LLILKKERNLILEKALAKEKRNVEILSIDLSLANDSNERMSKENTLINESLASIKASYSELQESFSCLSVKYKDLEVNYEALWESTKTNSKATLDSNVSTSKGCSRCYKIDVQACVANLAKLEKLIQAKDAQLERFNILVKNGYEGNAKPEAKIKYKNGRHHSKKDGLGHYKEEKLNDRRVVKSLGMCLVHQGRNAQ
jgi:hypothetical protein